jgi:hypothetical protein
VKFFNLPNPSGRTSPLGFTKPLTEMSTRNLKLNFVASVRERPPFVGEVSANVCGQRVSCGQRN